MFGALGAQRLQRIHPWDEPNSLRERGGQRVPTFRYGARGVAGIQLEVEAARETRRFGRQYCEVRIARRDGDDTQSFPFGTYKERVVHGAPVKSVPQEGTALVAMPGPTLEDIETNLDETKLDTQAVEDEAVVAARVHSLVTEVRSAMKDEAAAVVEQATGDVGEFRKKPEDRHVVVRHRYERNKVHAGDGTARVIVKRDRRRGRPPGKHAAHNRHGADPPA